MTFETGFVKSIQHWCSTIKVSQLNTALREMDHIPPASDDGVHLTLSTCSACIHLWPSAAILSVFTENRQQALLLGGIVRALCHRLCSFAA